MMQTKTWYLLDDNIVFRDMGIVNVSNRHPYRKGIACWVLAIMQKGQRTLLCDGEPIRIAAHEFCLLPPFTTHEPLEYDTHTACFLHFFADGTKTDAPTRVDASKLILPMTGPLPPGVDFMPYMEILENHTISPYGDRDFLTLQLQAILSLISLHCQKTACLENHDSLAEQILQYIQQNACTPLRAQDYEDFSGKSYHHINLLFKRQFGCTIKQYHMHLRMEKAAHMLTLGKTIQETALSCGFDDYFYFINSFSKAHGIAPAAYRKQGQK